MFSNLKAIERLENRCKDLELRCESLDAARRSLNLEFTELYDKVSHQMSRMAKRYANANKAPDEPEDADTGNSHSPTLDPISKSIMLRRARLVGPLK